MDDQKLVQFQHLSGQLQQFQQYMELIEQQLSELAAAKRSVEEIQSVKEGTELKVPLANGIYVDAQLLSTKKVCLNIGQGVIVEKSPADALDLLSTQFSEIATVQEQIHQQFSHLYQEYVQLQLDLEGQ